MPYVRRNSTGTVISLHLKAEGDAREWLTEHDPEVLAFSSNGNANQFHRLDAEFIRVLEDLIDVLLARRVINVTDLPAAAQLKLNERRDVRRPSSLGELNLLGDAQAEDLGHRIMR